VNPAFGARQPIDPVEMRSTRPGPLTPRERVHPFWARAHGPLAEVPGAHAAALTFLSDYLVTASPFGPGTSEGEGMNSHTLEHSLWFHRSFSAERWMLFDCAPLTQSVGRFVSRGTVHDEGGSLLASFVQEGLIRPV
jgi:acyl-CoA thioesterase II